MATHCGVLGIEITLDGDAFEGQSGFSWAAGGRVLTIATVLPAPGLAVELVSTYVGHSRTGTIATHLVLGPGREAARISAGVPGHDELDPVGRPRACVYDHAHYLMDVLAGSGVTARVHVSEETFAELEEIE